MCEKFKKTIAILSTGCYNVYTVLLLTLVIMLKNLYFIFWRKL